MFFGLDWRIFSICLVVCEGLKTVSCHISPLCTTSSLVWPVPPELRCKSELDGVGLGGRGWLSALC